MQISKITPIRLLRVLHKNDETSDTLIPGDPNPYVASDQFDPPEIFENPAGNLDALIRNHAGVAWCQIPMINDTFEEHKYQIHKGIEYQKELLLIIKWAHRQKCLNDQIYDRDYEECYMMRNWRDPFRKTSKQWVEVSAIAPIGHRAIYCYLALNDMRIIAKARGLNTAKYFWKDN